jgi:hypothetical protein
METPVIGKGSTKDLGFRAIVVTQFLTTFKDNAFRMTVILLVATFFAFRMLPGFFVWR